MRMDALLQIDRIIPISTLTHCYILSKGALQSPKRSGLKVHLDCKQLKIMDWRDVSSIHSFSNDGVRKRSRRTLNNSVQQSWN